MSDRLRDLQVPGEAAAHRRAWAVAQAALAERRPARRGPAGAHVVLAALAAALIVLALTPPGRATADWVRDQVRDVVGTAAPPARPRAVQAPPGGGRLLAAGDHGPVVLGLGAPRQLLGAVDEAAWSPHGRFVAAVRGVELIAVDLHGRRRWHVAQHAAIHSPRWSPSGFRVAYVAGAASSGGPTGRVLRVVAGDGTGDHAVAAAGAAAPAWKPTQAPRLAYADAANRVVLADPDSGRILWRTRPHLRPHLLAWSSDGRRLLVIAPDKTYIFSGVSGAVLRNNHAPAGSANVAAAYQPGSYDYAVVRSDRRSGESRVVLVHSGPRRGIVALRERLLLATPGRVRSVAWSPDGRWLAVDASRADGWLLLRVRGGRLAGVRVLAAGRGARLSGWCCTG